MQVVDLFCVSDFFAFTHINGCECVIFLTSSLSQF
jgi:hypothetical protein